MSGERHGQAVVIERGGEGPPTPMGADCSTPSRVTATLSPTGACEPLASVPEMVTVEVP